MKVVLHTLFVHILWGRSKGLRIMISLSNASENDEEEYGGRLIESAYNGTDLADTFLSE